MAETEFNIGVTVTIRLCECVDMMLSGLQNGGEQGCSKSCKRRVTNIRAQRLAGSPPLFHSHCRTRM